MNQFPPLSNWFRFLEQNELYDSTKTINNGYYEYNECLFFTLLWKDGADKESFIKEFVKLIARIRGEDIIEVSPGKTVDFCGEFIKYIDTGYCSLTNDQKTDYLDRIMARGMRNIEKKFDEEGTRGHIGEILFFLLREQFIDSKNKIEIHSSYPKRYSKEPGLDFTEIRCDENGYYLIIGEIKSTKNSIGSYPNKIINQLTINHQTTFLEHYDLYKEKIKNGLITSPKLVDFIQYLPNYSSFSSCNFKSDKKRFLGVINYGNNSIHGNKAFNNFKNGSSEVLVDNINCRKVKLIGIKDFDTIVNGIYNYIFVDFLR